MTDWVPAVCRIHLMHVFSTLSFDAFLMFESFIFEGTTYYLKNNKTIRTEFPPYKMHLKALLFQVS